MDIQASLRQPLQSPAPNVPSTLQKDSRLNTTKPKEANPQPNAEFQLEDTNESKPASNTNETDPKIKNVEEPANTREDSAKANGLSTGRDRQTLDEAFTDFVGQTLFGSMLASMRKTVGKPAYMHGGRTEEVFQQQLDKIMVEELTDASAAEIAQPMLELFQLQRGRG